MKYLNIKYVNGGNREITIEALRGKVFVTPSNEFIRAVNAEHPILGTIYSGNTTAQWYDGFYILMCDEDLKPTTDERIELEKSMARMSQFEEYTTDEYKFLVVMGDDSESDLARRRDDIDTLRMRYINAIDALQREEEWYNIKLRKAKDIVKNYEINSSGEVIVEFEDVVAEDTDAELDDIELGTLKFAVRLDNPEYQPRLIHGTNPQSTNFTANAYHPHQLDSSGRCCFGGHTAELVQGITMLQMDVVQAVLYNFAHSFTSSDEAGESAKAWLGIDMEGVVELITGGTAPESEAVWSEREDGYILDDEAVWSEFSQDSLIRERAVFSNTDDSWIHEDDVIEMPDGDYVHEDSDNYRMLESGEYAYTDDVVVDVDGDNRLDSECEYSNNMGEFIYKDYAIEVDGDWYTEDYLNENATQDEEGQWILNDNI